MNFLKGFKRIIKQTFENSCSSSTRFGAVLGRSGKKNGAVAAWCDCLLYLFVLSLLLLGTLWDTLI